MKIEYRIQCRNDNMNDWGWHDDVELLTWQHDNLKDCLSHIDELRKEAREDDNGFKYRIIERKFKDKIFKTKKGEL